jgi:integrase
MPKKIDAQWVDRVKAPTDVDRVEYFDEKVTGLILRVTKAGKKSWYLQYRVKPAPKKRRMALGSYPATSLANAREKAQEHLLTATRGKDPGVSASLAPESPQKLLTFGRLTELYVENYARKKRQTWAVDQARLDRNFFARWGDRPAGEITKQDVEDAYERIERRGTIEANRNLQLVRAIYNWAIAQNLLEKNPTERIKLSSEASRERVLTEAEIRKVWEATHQLTPQMGAIYRLKLIIAQRSAEVEAMRWQDIDGHWWNIPGPLTKPKRAHRVYLPRMALDEIDEFPRRGTWIFPSDSRSGHVDNVGKALARIKRLSGIDDFTGHDFRRTAATFMAQMKVPRSIASRVLNHSGRGDESSGVTAVYVRYGYDDEKKDALEKWAAKLREIIGRQDPVSEVAVL